MRRLPVNLDEVESVIECAKAIEYSGSGEAGYVDLQTGEVVEVWEDDDEFAGTTNESAAVNAAARERVEAEPERYVLVTELDVGDPRELLREFLHSDWTTDAKKRERAWEAYSGAVGRWRREVGDETIVHAWRDFESRALRRRIVELLAEHGVEVVDVAKPVG